MNIVKGEGQRHASFKHNEIVQVLVAEYYMMEVLQLNDFFFLFYFIFCLFVLLGPHPWHMEVPRLGV